jgi:DNA-binding CsgD family transcriptional regulator/hemerythrin
MTPHHTGHAEIDQQHQILENLIEELGTFCPKADESLLGPCNKCSSIQSKQCAASLTLIVSELIAFHIGHSTYEERMMELLPSTSICQAHIKAHKASHEGMLKQLKKFTPQFINENLGATASHMRRLFKDWLGDHVVLFDNHLVGLSSPAAPKIDFDGELVAMLDEHVFPNRPIMTKPSTTSALSLRKKKLEVRGRFESLSTSQRAVFWLVVSGKTNRVIAEELGVTVNTIKTHRAAVFQKMEVGSVVELVKKADVLR